MGAKGYGLPPVTLLSQILPALRQVRAPLVGGYLWLLAAWLHWSESVPAAGSRGDDRYWRAMERLSSQLGAAGTLAAVSIAAYLVGSVVSEVVSWAIRLSTGLDSDEMEQAREIWQAKYAAEVPMRLLAEAELRFNVAVPLLAIMLVLRPTLLTLLLLGLILLMATHGWWLLRSAMVKWDLATRISRIDATDSTRQVKDADADDLPRPGLHEALDELSQLAPNAQLSAEPFGESEMFPADGIRVTNPGPGSARQVVLLDGDNQELAYFDRGTFPIAELPPGTDVRLPFRKRPSASQLQFWLVWEDRHGSQRELVRARVGGYL